MISETIVILAGGEATRIRPITEKIPKSLVEIAGRPFIGHQIQLLKKNEFKNIVICTGFLGRMIEDVIGNGNKCELNVKYSYDGEVLLGTGGAIKKALPILSDVFLVIYGDSYLDVDYGKILEYFYSTGKAGLMTVFKNEGKWDSSNVIFKNAILVEYDKKEKSPEMEYIDYGLGIFRKNEFDKYEVKGKFDLAEYYKFLLKTGNLTGFEVKNRFYEIGSFDGIKETKLYLNNKE